MTPRALLSTLGSGLLVLGLAATGVAAATTATATTPSAARADAQATIELWAPDRIEAFSEGGRTFPPLGLRVIAPTTNVEVWSHRASFEDPIVSEIRTTAGTTRLPAGSLKDFSGIDGFIVMSVRREGSGKNVVHRKLDACLAATGERARPDAPATSPYPRYCPYSPYTLGSVMGVQQGWAANVFEYSGLRPLPLGPGKYVVETHVAKKYWPAFGLTAATASTTTKMKVVEGCPDCGVGRSEEPAPAGHHGRTAPGARPTERASGSAGGAVPDLRSLPAFGIELNRKGTTLRFSATVWNGGSSPLVIDGFRRRGAEIMDAYQYFFDTDGNQTGYQQVGTMEFHHANHNHWHFEDFARYDLLDANKKYVAKSRKQSFCLANTDAVDYTVPGADWQPENTDLATACGDEGALSIREVLASGSGDTYAQYRAGQAFRIGDLPNGVYYIRVEGNPERNLTESDTANNVADRRIRIGGEGANRWVKAEPIGDIVEPPTFFRAVS
ncbi:Lysyl oxidase [Nocardioides exalbidus]|uniref:Lysyl oxidase n=1 Tax=Nocardioides exalbidus TaxID=402596 RepID=A0A1H4VJS1_9ACTN|nr:lysyl oxidase family protein [Nocardioides exalbidus]SEC81362.1 Lysyl oxidase [Nocardioides exalbidus]